MVSYQALGLMKQIVAIVKPFLAESVIEAVSNIEIEHVVVRQVKGYGRQKNYLDQYGSNEYANAFVAKVEVAIWVQDDVAEHVVASVNDASRTGRMGDGKILVLPVCGMG